MISTTVVAFAHALVLAAVCVPAGAAAAQRHRAALDREAAGNPVEHAVRWQPESLPHTADGEYGSGAWDFLELFWTPSAESTAPDWAAINAALANSSVVLKVGWWTEWSETLLVQRTDESETWLVITSADYKKRARIGDGKNALVAWQEQGRQARIRVQGLALKGRVHLHSADYVQYADNQVIGRITHGYAFHGDQGDPGSNTGILLLNNVVYNPDRLGNGECIYIGGSENQGKAAHSDVRIVANRVYDCTDCIDLKDELSNVWVTDNDAYWCNGHGIVTHSSGTFARNVIASVDKSCISPSLMWGHEPERWFHILDNACVGSESWCVQASGWNKEYDGEQRVVGQIDGNTCLQTSRSIGLFDEDGSTWLGFVVRNNLIVDNTIEALAGAKPTVEKSNTVAEASVFEETDLRKKNALVPRDIKKVTSGVARNGTDVYGIEAWTTRIGATEPLGDGDDDRGPLLSADALLPEVDIGRASSASTTGIVVGVVVVVFICIATVAFFALKRKS